MWTRRFRPARALTALALGVLVLGGAARAGDDSHPAAPSGSVDILDAQRDGWIDVSLRGQGQDRVRFTLTSRSPERLQVILPPGLVAAASTGQGFQSMGLGLPTDQPGRFGGLSSATTAGSGFRSIGPDATPPAIAIASGQTVEFTVPSVCLNFGLPTPTPRDEFLLMDVADYTPDIRARQALRSLATLGTSQGVAQAVAWNVFNQMSFAQMAKQASKYLNTAELSVAARFVAALDASIAGDIVDPAEFQDGRILIHVRGEGDLAAHALRLNHELATETLLGLPVQVVDNLDDEHTRPSSLHFEVSLAPGEREGRTRARVRIRHNSVLGGWTRLDAVDLNLDGAPATIKADRLARSLDEAIARAFVSATPARRAPGLTTFRVVNRLPMTVRTLVVRTGQSEGAPITSLDRIEVGPGRSAMIQIPAPAAVVDRIELSGL